VVQFSDSRNNSIKDIQTPLHRHNLNFQQY